MIGFNSSVKYEKSNYPNIRINTDVLSINKSIDKILKDNCLDFISYFINKIVHANKPKISIKTLNLFS